MWPFNRKKSITEVHLLAGGTDYHSHILPGVDDGVRTTEEALQVLQDIEATGITDVWFTPHIMEDYPNTCESLKELFATFRATYKGYINLHLAAEYMLDNHFTPLLESNNLLPIGRNGNHLLVETSYYTPPMSLHATLQQIKAKGYFPLLAHPERYLYMEKKDYKELLEMGIKFQLNLPSLAGFYGPEVKKRALWLLKNNIYSVAGSDTHSGRATEVIESITLNNDCLDKLKKLLKTEL